MQPHHSNQESARQNRSNYGIPQTKTILNIFMLFFWPLSLAAFGATPPPSVFVDKDACPFECCTYREWTVEKTTEIYNSVDEKKIVDTAKKGIRVKALTGEVQTTPLKIQTTDGVEIYLLTYEGEGSWKIWRSGKVESGIEAYWETSERPKSIWWVQIKLPNGKIGWTNQPENFGNKDACG